MARPEPTHLEHLSDASFLGKLLVLPANVRLDWKVIASHEHSSLFGLVISDEGKKFYNIDTRPILKRTGWSTWSTASETRGTPRPVSSVRRQTWPLFSTVLVSMFITLLFLCHWHSGKMSIFCFIKARVFVPGKPFQPSVVIKDKHSSLLRKPYITAIISFLIQAPGRTYTPKTNALAYFAGMRMTKKKKVLYHWLQITAQPMAAPRQAFSAFKTLQVLQGPMI